MATAFVYFPSSNCNGGCNKKVSIDFVDLNKRFSRGCNLVFVCSVNLSVFLI